MCILRFFTREAFSAHKTNEILDKLKLVDSEVEKLSTELCYHVELAEGCEYLNIDQIKILQWLLNSPLQPHALRNESEFKCVTDDQIIIEIGPRFNFSTADSSNSVQICENVGLRDVIRLEVSTRYLITFEKAKSVGRQLFEDLAAPLHDRMTQCIYTKENLPRKSFNEGLPNDLEPWYVVPLLKEGMVAMEKVNNKLGLAFDSWDMQFYMDLFVNKLKRDPTSVELFDLAQSNSEHSRHWFFKGKIILDGEELSESLIDMVASTQKTSNPNNVIKFGDNSSAIAGFEHPKLRPADARAPSRVLLQRTRSDIIFTAETHNMPTAVAPFSGAATGTGGRIRDVQAVGRGGHTVGASAGYSVGNLRVPGYELPWEDRGWAYPRNFASPLQILIDASNGASDYGNKFGEPVVLGFVHSYGMKNADGAREEFVKPIMFSGGIGYMPHDMIKKNEPEPGMLVVKVGGPVYRIGVGGGAASSVAVQGGDGRDHALDFGAVQRGDAEMGNRLNRVVRACLEADVNPIEAIHDQGAGGNGNVLKELVEPAGAVVFAREFALGDPTLTALELWGAEYQESDALLCSAGNRALLEEICARERCPVAFVGAVTGDGYVSLLESGFDAERLPRARRGDRLPYDLHLEAVLGNVPRKTFDLRSAPRALRPLELDAGVTVEAALARVLRLPAVASKRYLTNKVDRCVSGLVAQQQCVGPLHAPLADCAVVALSHHARVGAATSLGAQPVKGLLRPEAGARMALGEALTNLAFAAVSELADVKCSANWMWPGKSGAEGAALVRACGALCDAMRRLGVAVDGGKDSLSMCASVQGQPVRSPGTLVVSAYAPCPDVALRVEPCLLRRGAALLHVPVSAGSCRVGGSALAQCYGQLGDAPPDLDRPEGLKALFEVTQELIREGKIISGHDVSEGGLVTTVLEMAIGGVRGVRMAVPAEGQPALRALFHEELGLVLEVDAAHVPAVVGRFERRGVRARAVGTTGEYGMDSQVEVRVDGELVLQSTLVQVYRLWEETSYRLERLQANVACVQQEWDGLGTRKGPTYVVTFDPSAAVAMTRAVRVAVLREEGTNGDREMIAALTMAHFEVFDVTMSDLHARRIALDAFQGVVFPGGFSYADTLGSAKGWAAGVLFSETLSAQFQRFKDRADTFALGVCNGCQLMALLGWVDPPADGSDARLLLDRNLSERFECRWSAVRINESPAEDVWFRGMGGSVLGAWVAHGEGRFRASPAALRRLREGGQLAAQYVDDDGAPTERYPMNPNGSPEGAAGVRSACGRRLALMPHPERCVLRWQCPAPAPAPAAPADPASDAAPWLRMFRNAYAWASRQ